MPTVGTPFFCNPNAGFGKASHVKIARRVAAALVLVAACACQPASAADGVAVVELFTSEGCSSCPSADRLLSTVVAETAEDGRPIFPIAYHVDYWNGLGWSDRFAHPAWTDLQRAYAQHLGEARIYTPQMVVNGRRTFVGSDAAALRRALNEELARATPLKLGLDLDHDPEHRIVTVSLSLEGDVSGVLIRFFVVERGLVTQVSGGENRGRELHHDNVVRAARAAVPDSRRVRTELELPADLARDRATVIAYAQNVESLEIVGATAAALID